MPYNVHNQHIASTVQDQETKIILLDNNIICNIFLAAGSGNETTGKVHVLVFHLQV